MPGGIAQCETLLYQLDPKAQPVRRPKKAGYGVRAQGSAGFLFSLGNFCAYLFQHPVAICRTFGLPLGCLDGIHTLQTKNDLVSTR